MDMGPSCLARKSVAHGSCGLKRGLVMQSGLLHISTHVSNSPTPSGTNEPSLAFTDIQSAFNHTDRHVGLCKLIIGHVLL